MDWHSPSLFAILDARDGKTLLEHSLPGDYTQVFVTLAAHGIRYLIAGRAAVSLHGVPRTTEVLDLIVDLHEDNLLRFLAAMEDQGFAPRCPMTQEDLTMVGSRDNLIRGSSTAICSFHNPGDLSLSIDIPLQYPLPFAEVFSRRQEIPLGGLKVPVLSIDDLIMFLTRYGRERDLRDVQVLEKVREMREKDRSQ